jgi:hypothetical protein
MGGVHLVSAGRVGWFPWRILSTIPPTTLGWPEGITVLAGTLAHCETTPPPGKVVDTNWVGKARRGRGFGRLKAILFLEFILKFQLLEEDKTGFFMAFY